MIPRNLYEEFEEEFRDYIDNYGTFEGTKKHMKGYMKANYGITMKTDDLDTFCHRKYNMNYEETYKYFVGVTDGCMRKAITNLAKDGNSKALDIAAEHFMKLGQEETKMNARITINASIPLDTHEKE